MTSTIKSDYAFFKDAVEQISSSLDLQNAMQLTFNFFKKHFPIDGLSLHQFDIDLNAMRLLFLVLPDKFHFLDKFIPLPENILEYIKKDEQYLQIINIPYSFKRIIPKIHSDAISDYLPNKDRSRLVAFLSTQDKDVNFLVLIGSLTDCFTAEHEHKLRIIRPAFSLLMRNLLQYHEIEELKNRLTERNFHLAGRLRQIKQNKLVGKDGGLRWINEMITQVSGQDVPVLILGETGTGKELIADAIQRVSTRNKNPFVKVNCGAIPETLIDSELFGHEKGAFTGATRSRPGRFELANGGTLFLDEIGDMPLNIQTRLLRVLQDGLLERVGSSRTISIDVRVIAATHRNLPEMVHKGQFREDLYYRLNVFPIKVPPLRERLEDLPMLIHHFITKQARRLRLSSTPSLSSDALPELLEYAWPGNVRELENLVSRSLVLTPEGPLKLNQYLQQNAVHKNKGEFYIKHQFSNTTASSKNTINDTNEIEPKGRLQEWIPKVKASTPTLDEVMANHIRDVLHLCNGKIFGPGGAGEVLNINPNTLRKRMDKLKIPYGRNMNL